MVNVNSQLHPIWYMRTYHLQFVLPELLLPGLIEERELPDMVDKDVSKDG